MPGSRLLRIVETAERLPPPFRPPFWGALLGIAVTSGLILACLPLWIYQGRPGIASAAVDMALSGVLAGISGGGIALLLGDLRRIGAGGYYTLWVASNAGAALIFLAFLRLLGRGEVLGLDRPLAPVLVAGLGALNGIIMARALGRSARESDGEFRSAANLVAGALLAETAQLERRARSDRRAAAELDEVRQAAPSSAYLQLLERVGARLAALPEGEADVVHARSHVAELVARVRDDMRRLAQDPAYGDELRHRQEVAEQLFRKELEREARRLRKSGDTGPEARATLGAIERELREGGTKQDE